MSIAIDHASNTPSSAPGAWFAGTARMTRLPVLGVHIWVNPTLSLGIASTRASGQLSCRGARARSGRKRTRTAGAVVSPLGVALRGTASARVYGRQIDVPVTL